MDLIAGIERTEWVAKVLPRCAVVCEDFALWKRGVQAPIMDTARVRPPEVAALRPFLPAFIHVHTTAGFAVGIDGKRVQFPSERSERIDPVMIARLANVFPLSSATIT